MIEIPFANHSAESFSAQAGKERLTNMFAETDPGRSRIIRRQRPGLTLSEGDASGSNLRGIQKFGSTWYLVVDDTFYSWDETTLTTLGTINTTSSALCTFAQNISGHIAMCDQTDLWNWNGSTLTQVTEGSWSPNSVSSLAGYGIIDDSDTTGRFYTTALNDFTDVDALDFANAEASPDDVVRIFVDRGEVWMFGKDTTEVFRLSGTSFPLAKVTGSEMARGCAAAYSVASDDNSIFWLGDDGIVYRANGYSPERISTHAIERDISDVSDTSTGQAFFYQLDGNKFYTLRFPGALTVQYNVATGAWNHAKTYLKSDWEIVGSPGRTNEYVLHADGICKLDDTVNKDITTTLRREAITPPMYNSGNRFTTYSYFLDCEVGRITDATTPEVMMEVSRDGEGWGNILSREMGAMGEYRRRVMWRKLGTAREMQFRIACTDDVPFKVMGAGGMVVPAVT